MAYGAKQLSKVGAPEGNNNAGKNKPFWRALDKAIAQSDGQKLRDAAEKLLDAAANGEAWAIRELADRMDGKAAQAITGADGGPFVIIQATSHDEAL